MMKSKLYRYVLVTDDGIAPCSENGLLTLGTCKPVIRRKAQIGDWVAGYNPKAKGSRLLVWAGRIAAKRPHIAYEQEQRGRKDAAYRLGPDGMPERVFDYHMDESDKRKDLSADVLIFDREATWYFGNDPRQPPDELARLVPKGQGHRVHVNWKEGDVELLEDWLRSVSSPGIHAPPRDVDGSGCISACASRRKVTKKQC